MAWTRLTDREADYAEYLLDAWEGQRPAQLSRKTIHFVPGGLAEFLDVLVDEVSYDRSCGARTVGGRLLAKLQRLQHEGDAPAIQEQRC